MKALVVIAAMLLVVSARATISEFGYLAIDLTNSPATLTNVDWSEPDKFSTSTNGFGWPGATNENRDYWLQSVPVAVGTSWRPARSIGIQMNIEPSSVPTGRFLIRYSPDKKHWSQWRAIEPSGGSVEVPENSRAEYEKLLEEYSKMDVPWTSDEEAAVRWILRRDPNFFEKYQPFIGYLQFRMEGALPGNIRIKKIEIRYGWGLSGLHSAPKDVEAYQGREGHWRFEAQ